MKKYVYIGLILSFSLCAEENPFSLNENLQKIDKAEKQLLSYFKDFDDSKLKKEKVRFKEKSTERLKSEEYRKNEDKARAERIAKAKKIREEHAETIRSKRLAGKKRNEEIYKANEVAKKKKVLSDKNKETNKAYLNAIRDVNL